MGIPIMLVGKGIVIASVRSTAGRHRFVFIA
jgi:hypothetical protein